METELAGLLEQEDRRERIKKAVGYGKSECRDTVIT
jgi:hypothetical protein